MSTSQPIVHSYTAQQWVQYRLLERQGQQLTRAMMGDIAATAGAVYAMERGRNAQRSASVQRARDRDVQTWYDEVMRLIEAEITAIDARATAWQYHQEAARAGRALTSINDYGDLIGPADEASQQCARRRSQEIHGDRLSRRVDTFDYFEAATRPQSRERNRPRRGGGQGNY